MNFLIGSDICVTKSNSSLFSNGDILELIGSDLKKILEDVDFRIFNLEGPLTNSDGKISKCGPNLKMPPESICGLKALNPSLFSLSNNHIMDYGKQGYEETLAVLGRHEIPFVGSGDDIFSVKKNHIFEKNSIRVGFYACAEHEFTIAQSDFPGANPYDPLETFDDIYALKQGCDFVVVLYHGGKEYYRYPSPGLQKRFRKMVAKGADLVIAQHTHCIGCKEEYLDSMLIYGQGNFIFDGGDNEFWNTGLLIRVELTKNSGSDNLKKSISFVPYQKISNGRIRIAEKDLREKLLSEFYNRSEEIKDRAKLEEKFSNFSENILSTYLNALHGNNLIFRIMRKVFGKEFVRKLYLSPNSYNTIRNFVECECHREVLVVGLKNEAGK